MDELTQRILDVARRAGRTAAGLCRQVLAEAPAAPEAMAKLGKEPVTLADYGSQAVILREVAAAFPDHGVLSEEGAEHLRQSGGEGQAVQVARLVSAAIGSPASVDEVCGWIDHQGTEEAELIWAIDPIDGTKGYLRRQQYAVAIGVLRRGRPHAGALVCPNLPWDDTDPGAGLGVMFVAARGAGAWRESLDEPRRSLPARVSDRRDPAEVRVLGSVESAHGDPQVLTAVMDDLGLGGGVVRIDSQAKYGVVASGGAEVYLRPQSRPDYRENIWDHAAGVIVIEEAGGRVSDLYGLPLDFSRGKRLVDNRGVLATHGPLHDAVLASLGRILGEAAAR